MNAYFENANVGYNKNVRTRELPTRRLGDGLISFICTIVAIVTCPVAVMLEKTALMFALFLGFFGVAGAIEAGTLSMLAGIFICGIISLLEYAILKSFWKNDARKSSEL